MRLDLLLRQLNVLNFILMIGLTLMIIFLVVPRFSTRIKNMPVATPPPAEQSKGAAAAQPVLPPLQEYAMVPEKNLFHSKRVLPSKKADDVPRPEFVLYGTLIMDNLKIAYLIDEKAPRTTAGRGKRQTGLKLGETMSGYTLREVRPDRIVMARGEDRIEIKVIAPGGKKNRGVDGAAVPSKTPKPATPPKPARSAVTPRPASPGGAAGPAASTRRSRDQRVNPGATRTPAR